VRRILVLALAVVLLAGCGNGNGRKEQTLTVLAAASLTKSFTQIGRQFEADHPGVRVRFSFGGSSDLASQIRSGAPADVFASADTRTMAGLGATARHPRDFASNTLEIAVPPGNPAHVAGLADLARPGLKLVTCAPEVPCGSAARAVAKATGLILRPVSQEQSVTDVLGKVSSGEADAGLVYVTDVKGAHGSVEGVTFPEAAGVVNSYPIAVLQDSGHAAVARQFVDFVLGPTGRRVLGDAGFGAPRPAAAP
jgi:molybdate transport system substrate-binding protein